MKTTTVKAHTRKGKIVKSHTRNAKKPALSHAEMKKKKAADFKKWKQDRFRAKGISLKNKKSGLYSK